MNRIRGGRQSTVLERKENASKRAGIELRAHLLQSAEDQSQPGVRRPDRRDQILPEITYGNDYHEIHRVNGTMINEGKLAAEFSTKRGVKKFVVIHDTTDYGKGQSKYFSEYLTPAGGEIVATFPVSPDQQDFTAELTKIKELKPDLIMVGGLTPLGVRLRTQMERVTELKLAFELELSEH